MIPSNLLQILRCPQTKQPVRQMTAEELADCNRRIALGEIVSQADTKRTEPLTDALIREDGKLVFPVENDIPVMLPEDALIAE